MSALFSFATKNAAFCLVASAFPVEEVIFDHFTPASGRMVVTEALPEERVTYHVLESDKPAAALVDYAAMNDVAQILIGAPGSGALPWRFAGIGREVVGSAPCTVTVVRPRAEG